MKLHLISDVHLDHDEQADAAFVRDYRNDDQADTVVVAGDVYSTASPRKVSEFLRLLAGMYEHVLYVPGNHDFWCATPAWVVDEMVAETAADTNIHLFMHPQFQTIGAQRFLGGTMWYPAPAPYQMQTFIDMRQTRCDREWFFKEHDKFLWELARAVPSDVVVTHHLPHPGCTPDRFRNNPQDHYFMTNLTDEILSVRPKLWLAGHTHDACDFVVGDTRIVINPRAYPHEYQTRPPYKPFLIEV